VSLAEALRRNCELEHEC
jgi:hypothetical protein